MKERKKGKRRGRKTSWSRALSKKTGHRTKNTKFFHQSSVVQQRTERGERFFFFNRERERKETPRAGEKGRERLRKRGKPSKNKIFSPLKSCARLQVERENRHPKKNAQSPSKRVRRHSKSQSDLH